MHRCRRSERTVKSHWLRPHIEAVEPLEQAAEAHRLIEQGRTTGKIVLTVSDPGHTTKP